jgi:DNA-binding transcriptional MerR regulator
VCAAAGITYRQLDRRAHTGLVEPSVRATHGSGSQRLYSFRDIPVLKVVKRLLDTGSRCSRSGPRASTYAIAVPTWPK